MRVVFRTDASRLIGTGHVVRCMTLAAALVARGAKVEFVCRSHDNVAPALLKGRGFNASLLPPARSKPADTNAYSGWAGASISEDAQQTASALLDSRPDWLVVDHYALSEEWETELKPYVNKILAIDDLGRAHSADVVLDQNFSAAPEARYAGLVPTRSRLMLGPLHALLTENYVRARRPMDRIKPVRRIAIFYGGVDEDNLTGRTLEALDHGDFKGIDLDVVLGSANAHAGAIADFTPKHVSISCHRGLPNLAEVLAAADMAIGAGGGNTWERCCLGLPSIVVSSADNQLPASSALGEAGVVRFLGRSGEVDTVALRNCARALLADPLARQELSERSRLLVDGRGAERVCEVMSPTPRHELELRTAGAGDQEFLFHLVNDPLVRAQSFSKEKVPWTHHKVWFDEKVNDPGTHLFVLEASRLAVGMIRFDVGGAHATLNYALDSIGRGKGWGITLVEMGLRALAAAWTGEVRASVKVNNRPSRLIFEKLAFQTSADGAPDDQIIYVLSAAEMRARYLPSLLAER